MVKNGILTTEFWLSVITEVAGLAHLTVSQSQESAVANFIVVVVVPVVYGGYRTWLKKNVSNSVSVPPKA